MPQVVFATETLAAGVNMPARTTVITVISKRGNSGIATLKPSAVLQMSGRAGRRGKDDIGNVVLCRSPFEDAIAAHALLLQPPEPINSHFFVSYGSALQMLAVRPVEACRDLVERSFGTFLAMNEEERASNKLEQADAQLRELDNLLAGVGDEELAAYVKLEERLTAELRTQTYLADQEAATTAQTMESLLPFVRSGTAVRLIDGRCATLIDDAPASLAARLPTVFTSTTPLLLLPDASFAIVEPRHIAILDPEATATAALPAEPLAAILSSLPPPGAWRVQPDGTLAAPALRKSAGPTPSAAEIVPVDPPESPLDSASAALTLAAGVVQLDAPEESATLMKQSARVDWVRSQLQAMSFHDNPRRDAILKACRDRADVARKQAKLQRQGGGGSSGRRGVEAIDGLDDEQLGGGRSGATWRQFEAVAAVLRMYGALEDWEATEFGDLVAGLAGDNELWLALVRRVLCPMSMRASPDPCPSFCDVHRSCPSSLALPPV